MRLATYASKCAENEILMYFRSTRKNASEMLLSDVLDTDGDGNNLSLIDILSEDDDMDEHLQADEVSRRCGAASAKCSMRVKRRSSACAMPSAAVRR